MSDFIEENVVRAIPIGRITGYAALGGYLVGVVAHLGHVGWMQAISPGEMCALGGDQAMVALIGVAPVNALAYGMGALAIATIARHWKSGNPD